MQMKGLRIKRENILFQFHDTASSLCFSQRGGDFLLKQTKICLKRESVRIRSGVRIHVKTS